MSVKGAKLTGSILLLVGFLTSCSFFRNSTSPGPSSEGSQDLVKALHDLHFDKYLQTPAFEPDKSQAQGWDLYTYPAEQLHCVTGDQYFIMARRGSETDKTVLWMEGGGACWPGRDDCAKQAQFYSWIQELGLASSLEENPVRSWNFIYLPYCDGSLHLGDSDADYDGDGVIDHWHWGLKTTSAAVGLMKALFPVTQKVLIGGCSAGGAGTIGASAVVRLGFPDARLYVLNVSGAGLINPAMTEIPQLVKETWNIGQFIPDDCPRCNQQITFMYAWLLERDPWLKVGLFSSYHDSVTSSGWGIPPADFESLLFTTTEAIRSDHSNKFNRFFIDGDSHCLDNYSHSVDGVTFWDWIDYLVNDDPRWTDILE